MYLAARSGAEFDPVGSEIWFVIVHRGDIRMGRCCPVRRPIVIVRAGDEEEGRMGRKEGKGGEVVTRSEFWRLQKGTENKVNRQQGERGAG